MAFAELRGRVAVVTGGGSNLGRAIGIALARQGVSVTVSDINVEAGRETARLIAAEGLSARAVRTDVA